MIIYEKIHSIGKLPLVSGKDKKRKSNKYLAIRKKIYAIIKQRKKYMYKRLEKEFKSSSTAHWR